MKLIIFIIIIFHTFTFAFSNNDNIYDKVDLFGEVLDKINEESSELINSIDNLNQAEIEEELGDILFTIVNLSRKLKVDPEKALNRTNEKFRYRLNGIEDELIKLGKSVKEVEEGFRGEREALK